MSEQSVTRGEDARKGAQLWAQVLRELQGGMTRATFDTWVGGTRVESYDAAAGVLVVGAPNEYAVQWLNNRLRATVERSVARVFETQTQVQFVKHTLPWAAPTAALAAGSEGTDIAAGDVIVRVIQNPTVPFIMVQVYALFFWQPLIGHVPFAVLTNLRTLDRNFNARVGNPKRVNVQVLARMVGIDRQLITGRARKVSGVQYRDHGAFDVLVRHRVADVVRIGSGRNVVYDVRVLNELPMLTPRQVAQLPVELQEWHAGWLREFDVDVTAWQSIKSDTLIEDWSGRPL